MKRLAIITVGKTHSGKTTFAKSLEQQLDCSMIMDQDNQAAFLNTYYEKLLPQSGPNVLKHSLSKVIIDYAIEQTNFHLIVSNANLSIESRKYLPEELFIKKSFFRIIVYFDIPIEILQNRVSTSQRSTNILRKPYSSFKEVLNKQLTESQFDGVLMPSEQEADHLLVIKHNSEMNSVIKEIVRLSNSLNTTDNSSV